MKSLLIILALTSAINSQAFTSCSSKEVIDNGLPAYSVNIYHTDQFKVLVTDRTVSMVPKAYLCDRVTMNQDGQDLAAYSCIGGDYNEEERIGVFVNETIKEAKVLVSKYEEPRSLECEIEPHLSDM